jgi:hypothetical protein
VSSRRFDPAARAAYLRRASRRPSGRQARALRATARSPPNFLYANAFYPNATTYMLSGLEPVGTVPDLTTLRGSVAPNLYQLRASLSSKTAVASEKSDSRVAVM